MPDGLRAAALILSLTFRADPLGATWLVLRSPINMCSILGSAYGLKLLTDAAVARDASQVGLAVAVLAGVLLLSTLAGEGSQSTRARVLEKASLRIDRLLIGATMDVPGLAHHEIPKHRDQLELLRLRRGELGEMVDTISHNLGMIMLSSGALLMFIQINPWLALWPLCGLPSMFATVYGEKAKVRAQERTAEPLRKARHLFETATRPAAGKEVRVFGLGAELLHRHRTLWNHADREQNRATWTASLLASGGWLLFSLSYVAAISYVVWLAAGGRASAGDVVMALKLAGGVNELVTWLAMMAGWMFGQLSTAGRIVWLMRYAEDSTRPHDDPAQAPETLRQGIRLRDVSFTYPETTEPVLSNVSLDIPAGTTLAVVGENGAGKTTLIKLLARLYDPTSGQIEVDGVDLRRIDHKQWRQRLSAGFQDFAQLELRAGETVGVGDVPHIDDGAAVAAALARAAGTDVVDGLPEGTATRLGSTFNDGVELSGGQWQKLALGRAMMRPLPLLLILDEPTASLDATTEHTLFERYAANAHRVAQRTGGITILISHRFSTVRMADRIAVLENGRLVEHGSHDELINRDCSYAELYSLQANAYR
jgi:ATP-binding cassette, subfamily B, bacterial